MDIPHIHSCMQMSSMNEQLKKKVQRLKHEKQDIDQQLKSLQEKSRLENLLRDYVTSRDVYVQTEPPKAWLTSVYGPGGRRKDDKPPVTAELEKTNKLLTMHNQLMKRYEKEVKTNITHIETISTLNIRIAELERKVKENEDKVKRLQSENDDLQKEVNRSRSYSRARSKEKDQARSRLSEKDHKPQTDVSKELQHIKKKCEKLTEQNKRLKSELRGLDHGFFEEIEDIKYALQQSAKLNREYERTLRKLCTQYAVPYPNPERMLQNKQ